ncbi:hypothetical protein QYF36_020374 [Acer negundo]|nr:hypothetical protein QYF36_020374 [Acer negundo]
MAFTIPSSISLKFHHHHHFVSKPTFSFSSKPLNFISFRPLKAIGPDGKFYPDPADDDPPEAPEDTAHGISKFQQIHRQASRARKRQEDDFKANQSTYLNAIADVEDPPVDSLGVSISQDDDFFGEVDKAVAMKRDEFVKKGLIQPKQKTEVEVVVEELEPQEVVDLEEIDELQGLRVVSVDDDVLSDEEKLSMYEAMGLRTGMLSSVAYYIHGDNKLESPKTTPDAVLVQNLMAKMLHNGTETVVMEASSHGLALGRCSEVDFDIAVFTNLTRDHLDFHGTEEEYRDAKAKLFSRMVDPERHRKVVNIDDPNASYFIAQGNPDVPVVTFAMDSKKADVHPLKFELSLFETRVLVNTPHGILEISSGLLGRHNIYNILAAVAVGIAVGAPLEDIVRGIEEVDAVPGRCELIDEEQAFGVIVDYAHTPDALSRLLDSVRELGPRRIITVFGCAGESDRGKRPMMTKIATDKSDVTILTSDNPKTEDPLDILDDMLAGVGWTMQEYLKHGENDYYPPLPNGNRIFLHDIRRVAVRCAVAMGEEGDIVVVAGKGHETYQIEGDKKEFFDDREECREALQYVDELHRAGIDTSEFPWRLPESH